MADESKAPVEERKKEKEVLPPWIMPNLYSEGEDFWKAHYPLRIMNSLTRRKVCGPRVITHSQRDDRACTLTVGRRTRSCPSVASVCCGTCAAPLCMTCPTSATLGEGCPARLAYVCHLTA